jgi:hypothetical protein
MPGEAHARPAAIFRDEFDAGVRGEIAAPHTLDPQSNPTVGPGVSRFAISRLSQNSGHVEVPIYPRCFTAPLYFSPSFE